MLTICLFNNNQQLEPKIVLSCWTILTVCAIIVSNRLAISNTILTGYHILPVKDKSVPYGDGMSGCPTYRLLDFQLETVINSISKLCYSPLP